MDIIYNEARAKESYQEYRKNITKNRYIEFAIGLGIALFGGFLGTLNLYNELITKSLAIAGGIIAALATIVTLINWISSSSLPLDAAYYEISQSEKILEVSTYKPILSDKLTICVKIEDEDGIVSEKDIGSATVQESTRIFKKTLDLHQGIVLEPYTDIQAEKEL